MDEVLLRVQKLAEEQHSTVSISQMSGCGATRKWILRRSAGGIIVKAGPSAFRMGGVAENFRNRAMAAVLSCQGLALVSHRSAAYLLGFERVGEPFRVQITVPRHRR